ncbi:glycosyltransferase family 2 protein [Methanobrevibacter sp.]
MDNQPLISVIVPSLNSQDYIQECLESILNQTLKEIEILSIDAGSTDKTCDIINQLASKDSRIKIYSSNKKSYGYQMNIGLNNANGVYIAIVESDDFIDKNMLQKLYELAKNYDADISKSTFYHYYDYESYHELKIDHAKKTIDVEDSFKVIEEPIFLDGHPSIWAAIYKNDFLKANNISFMEENGAAWVDNPFFYETTFSAERIVYRNIPFYYYRETNPNSSSNNLSDFSIPVKRMMDNLDIVEKYNVTDEMIMKHVYLRVFAYIYNIFRREGYEDHLDFLRPKIREMLLRLDEGLVLKHMKKKMKDTYYEFISPIQLIEDADSITADDLKFMLKENEYLYSRVNDLKKGKIKSDKKVKSLRKEMDSILNSKTYKIGSLFSKPFRILKSFVKR